MPHLYLPFTFGLRPLPTFAHMPSDSEKVEFLLGQLTPARAARMVAVAAARTRHVGLALEDIYQPHNASAVLRSADAFGIQDLHIIEHRNRFDLSRHVARGANIWLDLYKHRTAEACLTAIREKGHRIVATSPAHGSHSPADMPLDAPFTVFIGTEKYGLSPEVMDAADAFLHVPMRGFTESLNLSVCAAIVLQRISERLATERPDVLLGEEERTALLLRWLMKDVAHADAFLARQFG